MDKQDKPIPEHATCIQCGYALRGLASDAQCPECGKSIAESLKARTLRVFSIDHLSLIHGGANVMFVCCGISCLAACIIFVAMAGTSIGWFSFDIVACVGIVFLLGGVIVPLVAWHGIWQFGTPSADMPLKSQSWRLNDLHKFLLLDVVFALGLFIAAISEFLFFGPVGASIFAAAFLVFIFSMGVTFQIVQTYIMWIASRISDRKIESAAKLHRWLFPTLGVGIVASRFLTTSIDALWVYRFVALMTCCICGTMWCINMRQLKLHFEAIINTHADS